MQGSVHDQLSPSTLYRFNKAKRNHELFAFLQFKHKYQNYFNAARVDKVKHIYQHAVCGKNEHKHTVVVDRIGNIKIHELSKVFQDDELVHYTSQRLLHLSEQVVAEREQVIWIIDLNGKIMQLASKKILDCLQKIIAISQKYFPELLSRLVFVNTPMLFDTIWAKITPLISKDTLEKVVMIGDQSGNLFQYAQPEILPDFLGGDVSEEDFLAQNQQRRKQEEEDSSQEEVDFSSLKQALSGLKIGGSSLQSVSQTPLNTEADDK